MVHKIARLLGILPSMLDPNIKFDMPAGKFGRNIETPRRILKECGIQTRAVSVKPGERVAAKLLVDLPDEVEDPLWFFTNLAAAVDLGYAPADRNLWLLSIPQAVCEGGDGFDYVVITDQSPCNDSECSADHRVPVNLLAGQIERLLVAYSPAIQGFRRWIAKPGPGGGFAT